MIKLTLSVEYYQFTNATCHYFYQFGILNLELRLVLSYVIVISFSKLFNRTLYFGNDSIPSFPNPPTKHPLILENMPTWLARKYALAIELRLNSLCQLRKAVPDAAIR